MGEDLFQTFTEGRRRVEGGDLDGGIALWDQLGQGLDPQQVVPGLRGWLSLQASEAWS
jgi:hypothetical protein